MNYPLRDLENNLTVPHHVLITLKEILVTAMLDYGAVFLKAETLNSFKEKLHCYGFSNCLTHGIHVKQSFYLLL